MFTVGSIALAVDPLTSSSGALWLILWRLVQGVGAAMLFANSTAILTDAFPAERRGFALGINQVAAIAGGFIGLIVGGLLSEVDWRLVFFVSVPIGIAGTIWSYLSLHETSQRNAARIDWWGNALFAVGLTALLAAITYGIQPYGGHTMGWTDPKVITGLIGGVVLLIAFGVVETRVAEPMFAMTLFKIRAFWAGNLAGPAGLDRPRRPAVHADHLAAGHLAAAARLRLRGHPAVGRHLPAAADRRVPRRRPAVRRAVGPVRRPQRSPPAAC